jgi:SWI/SNF-related matrix-associated actin-dependent regulator of chromatin subfamily A3
VIRDRGTRQSKACLALEAERRWCLTGTPFQNKIADIYSLLAFLRVHPFTVFKWFNNVILKPLKGRDSKGLERLQMVLGQICLRRKKQEENGKKLLALPKKVSHTISCKLEGSERALYDTLAISGKEQFRHLLREDSVGRHYAFVLEILLRMRQACNHIHLVPAR